MTHDELQKVRNALAVATTHFARDRNIVLDAIVILNNALAEPPQRTESKVCCEEYDTCLEPCTPRGGHLAQRPKVVFPTMLRKMWSGGEVQAWLDENVNKEQA